MAKRGRPKKNKEVPLSKESEKLVRKGLKEASEGKLNYKFYLQHKTLWNYPMMSCLQFFRKKINKIMLLI